MAILLYKHVANVNVLQRVVIYKHKSLQSLKQRYGTVITCEKSRREFDFKGRRRV